MGVGMCSCVDGIFDDKRICVTLLLVWMSIVIMGCYHIGLLDSKFVTFGPSPTTVLMGMKLDTWYSWGMVASFTFVNTIINDFSSDSIGPFLTNAIADHKTKWIPYSKPMCLYITQMWTIYVNIMSLFGLFLSMTQIDFVLIRMTADLLVNFYSNMRFLRYKIHCPIMYHKHIVENPAVSTYQDPGIGASVTGTSDAAQRRRKEATMGNGFTKGIDSAIELYCITEECSAFGQEGVDSMDMSGDGGGGHI